MSGPFTKSNVRVIGGVDKGVLAVLTREPQCAKSHAVIEITAFREMIVNEGGYISLSFGFTWVGICVKDPRVFLSKIPATIALTLEGLPRDHVRDLKLCDDRHFLSLKEAVPISSVSIPANNIRGVSRYLTTDPGIFIDYFLAAMNEMRVPVRDLAALKQDVCYTFNLIGIGF